MSQMSVSQIIGALQTGPKPSSVHCGRVPIHRQYTEVVSQTTPTVQRLHKPYQSTPDMSQFTHPAAYIGHTNPITNVLCHLFTVDVFQTTTYYHFIGHMITIVNVSQSSILCERVSNHIPYCLYRSRNPHYKCPPSSRLLWLCSKPQTIFTT